MRRTQRHATTTAEPDTAIGPLDTAQSSNWSVVLPYYNEQEYLADTLHSLCRQYLAPSQLILVDNGSTDQSRQIARKVLQQYPQINVCFLSERQAGKIYALQIGVRAATEGLIATCDADTLYPAHYLATASKLFRTHPKASCVMAIDIYNRPDHWSARLQRAKIFLVSCIFRNQCHTGGYGQMFRTEMLRKSGGFDSHIWPFVLEDHEIIHRMLRQGSSVYHPLLWCQPSTRRQNNSRVSWNLLEKLIYNFTPWSAKDWFFYSFLSRRLTARQLNNSKLRDRNWEIEQKPQKIREQAAKESL
jgi:glycosyltransferase involved in cell wall biosynthesis